MASLGAGYSFSVNEQVTAAKLATLVTGGTCTSIVNADVDAAAAIANSKLNLASISQAMALSGGLTLSSNGLTMTSVPINEAQGSNVASATTPNITSTTGNYVHITGTTTITGFATAQAGIERVLVFDGILTFTHNATSLILPTGANITTAANDVAVMRSEGSGNWRCVTYYRKDGTSLSGNTAASQAEMETASSTSVNVTPGRTQYHPGVAKAWAYVTDTGTPTVVASHNVTSVTDNGTGDYTLNFTTSFSSGNYCVLATPISTSANYASVSLTASAAARIFIRATTTNNATDGGFFAAAYGDQ